MCNLNPLFIPDKQCKVSVLHSDRVKVHSTRLVEPGEHRNTTSSSLDWLEDWHPPRVTMGTTVAILSYAMHPKGDNEVQRIELVEHFSFFTYTTPSLFSFLLPSLLSPSSHPNSTHQPRFFQFGGQQRQLRTQKVQQSSYFPPSIVCVLGMKNCTEGDDVDQFHCFPISYK